MKVVDKILAVLIGAALLMLSLCILAVSCIENNKPVETCPVEVTLPANSK